MLCRSLDPLRYVNELGLWNSGVAFPLQPRPQSRRKSDLHTSLKSRPSAKAKRLQVFRGGGSDVPLSKSAR